MNPSSKNLRDERQALAEDTKAQVRAWVINEVETYQGIGWFIKCKGYKDDNLPATDWYILPDNFLQPRKVLFT